MNELSVLHMDIFLSLKAEYNEEEKQGCCDKGESLNCLFIHMCKKALIESADFKLFHQI